MMALALMDSYGVPRYIRSNGVIYRLPRGYRKRLQRAARRAMYRFLFQVSWEMWQEDKTTHRIFQDYRSRTP